MITGTCKTGARIRTARHPSKDADLAQKTRPWLVRGLALAVLVLIVLGCQSTNETCRYYRANVCRNSENYECCLSEAYKECWWEKQRQAGGMTKP